MTLINRAAAFAASSLAGRRTDRAGIRLKGSGHPSDYARVVAEPLVRGRAGNAARHDGAELAARLPRAAFPVQPQTALSQTAFRAVRLLVMAGTLRANYSHERARPRPAGLPARAK